MTEHYIIICTECDKVVSQCRCASPDKKKVDGICNDCKDKIENSHLDSVKIKPCPCCGGNGRLDESSAEELMEIGGSGGRYAVKCAGKTPDMKSNKKILTLTMSCGIRTGYTHDPYIAIEVWNRREG